MILLHLPCLGGQSGVCPLLYEIGVRGVVLTIISQMYLLQWTGRTRGINHFKVIALQLIVNTSHYCSQHFTVHSQLGKKRNFWIAGASRKYPVRPTLVDKVINVP